MDIPMDQCSRGIVLNV